jgi:hypothetical protein
VSLESLSRFTGCGVTVTQRDSVTRQNAG